MKLPRSFNDLTVRQFQQATEIINSEPDLLERHIKLIACLTGNSIEWVESHTPKKLGEMAKQMDFLVKPDLDKRIQKWVLIGKRIYKPILKADQLSAGQVLSLKTFEEKSKGTHKYLHEQLACVYTDINWYGKAKKYNASNHARIANDMLDAKLGSVYGTLFFYTNVLERLSPIMEIYLKEATQTIQEIMPEVMAWAKEQGLTTS